ncbi:RNA polymerase sigma factor [candidate division KSB1 bacterium]|nr:RNA polymerase sigma factor [candidate division KSB1 bacterium]
MNQPTDTRALINQIRHGNRDAFRTLVEQNKRLVSHVIYRTAGHINDHEDLCQDVFIKVYQNIHKFREDSKLSTWIAQIAFNTSINYLRKKRPSLYEDESRILATYETNEDLPDIQIEKMDRNQRIAKAIDSLPLQMRTVITLYHLEEMSYKEIGEIMNMPEGTMKSYLFRARKKLKNVLSQELELKDIQP